MEAEKTAAAAAAAAHPSSSSSSSSLVSIQTLNEHRSKTNYTSLRDVLVTPPNGDLCFKNPLVKHAACAYLHPKASPGATAPTSSRWSFFQSNGDEDEDDDGHVGLCALCSRLPSSLSSRLRRLLGKPRRFPSSSCQ